MEEVDEKKVDKLQENKIGESSNENKSKNEIVSDISKDNLTGLNNESGKEEAPKKDIVKKQNNQLKWAFFLMISLIVILVLVPYIKINYFDKFDYKGLEFQKTKLGDLIFYSSRFPVVSGTGQVTGSYSINLRNDPRELENINVNVSDNKIKFAVDQGKFGDVYISLYPFMDLCEDTGIAMVTLAGFLSDSGLHVSSGVTDKAYARDYNQTYKWCSPFETVIIVSDRGVFTEGNETAITEIGNNCYEIKFKNCEVMQASEKFMLTILEEYAERFSKNAEVN